MISLGLGLAVVWPAALLGVLALGAPAAGQGPPDGRDQARAEPVPSLVVAGRGEVRAAPDEATVRLGVLAQAATAGAAQQQANQTVTALLRAVSHDFRSPLTAIVVSAGALAHGRVPVPRLAPQRERRQYGLSRSP